MGTNKVISWWIGPCPIVDGRGADSYVITNKPGHRREVHSSQLKPYVEDQHADAAFPLHYWRMAEADVTDEVDEWEVDEITNHRTDDDGKIWFETKWSGFSRTTWEPLNHFVHRYSVDCAEYCKKHRVNANVIDHLLGAKPMIQEVQVNSVRENISIERVGRPPCQTCGGWSGSGRTLPPPMVFCRR